MYVYVNPFFSLNYANFYPHKKMPLDRYICILPRQLFISLKLKVNAPAFIYSVYTDKIYMPLNHIIFDNKFTAANIEIDVRKKKKP